MKQPLRRLISIFCLGAFLIAAFVLAVNLYVQSTGVQARLRSALSDVVGVPVTFFRTTFSPWNGFRLDQLKIASPHGSTDPDLLQSAHLEVRCKFFPLFTGKAVLQRIALESPVIVLQQNNAGHFQWIQRSDKKKPASAPPTTGSAPATRVVLPLPEPNIRKILLKNGSLLLVDREGNELLHAEAFRCSLNSTDTPGKFQGPLKAGKITLRKLWVISDIEAEVTVENEKVTISKFDAQLGEGKLIGDFKVDLSSPTLPYELASRLIDAQFPNFFPPDFELARSLDGNIHARINLTGELATDKREGHAEWKISRARINQIQLLQTIGELTGNDRWKKLSIKKAEIKADFFDDSIRITPSHLTANEGRVIFSGEIDPTFQVAFQGMLYLDEPIYQKLPSEARANFVPSTDPEIEGFQLDFTVNGPMESPRSNFVNRLIGDRLEKKMRGFLRGFVGESEPAPAPAEK